MKIILFAILPLLAALSISCGPDRDNRLVILHTNDTHGSLVVDPDEKGGVSRRMSAINRIRKEGAPVLLLDAGDVAAGTQYFSRWGWEPFYRAMSAMGYDAATLGNHEFDRGIGPLAAAVVKADFPFLCANADFSGTPLEGVARPYVTVNKGGNRIGIIGLMPPNSPIAEENGFRFLDHTETVNRLADSLRNRAECDLIVCLSHLGYPADVKLAADSRNVDIIVGGHTHRRLEKGFRVKNREGRDVLVSQAGSSGMALGRIDILFAGKDR